MSAPRPTPRPIKPGQGRPPDSWDGHNVRRNREWQKKRDAALAKTMSTVPVPIEIPELQSPHDVPAPQPTPNLPAPGPVPSSPLSSPPAEKEFFPVEDVSPEGHTRKGLAECLAMLGYCVPEEHLDVLLGPRKVPHMANPNTNGGSSTLADNVVNPVVNPVTSHASTPVLKSALKVTPKQAGLHERLVQLGVALPLDKDQPMPSESELTPSNYSDNGKFPSSDCDFTEDDDMYTPDVQKKCVQFLQPGHVHSGDSDEDDSGVEDEDQGSDYGTAVPVAPINKGKGIDPSERPQMPTVDEKDVTAEEDVTAEDGGDGEQDPGADEYINDEDDEEDEDSEDDEDGENNDANPRKAIFCVSDIFSDYMLQN